VHSNGFNEYVEDVLHRFENEVENLEDLLKIKSFSPKIYPLIKSSLLQGKKLRAILGVLSYQAVGGEIEKAIHLAVAIELAHNASLIHDDIVDNDEMRRGNAALYKKIGVGNAVVLGDAMILLSINIASNQSVEVVKLVSKYGFEICDGEFIDASIDFNNIENFSEGNYFLKIYKKSAALFKSSAYVAAFAAGGSSKENDALSSFGENIGIIYQIKDDIAELMEIKKDNYSSDLKNGIATLPIIHFYKNSNSSEKEFLTKIFGKEHSIEDSEKLLNAIENKGSIKYCKEKIKEREILARNSLKDLKDNEFKKLLYNYLDYILKL